MVFQVQITWKLDGTNHRGTGMFGITGITYTGSFSCILAQKAGGKRGGGGGVEVLRSAGVFVL